MNKRGQLAFDTSQFGQNSQTEISKNPNLFQRIIIGILAFIFLMVSLPAIIGVHTAVSPYVCGSVTTCLFFKFIIPALVIGGIISALKDMWGRE